MPFVSAALAVRCIHEFTQLKIPKHKQGMYVAECMVIGAGMVTFGLMLEAVFLEIAIEAAIVVGEHFVIEHEEQSHR